LEIPLTWDYIFHDDELYDLIYNKICGGAFSRWVLWGELEEGMHTIAIELIRYSDIDLRELPLKLIFDDFLIPEKKKNILIFDFTPELYYEYFSDDYKVSISSIILNNGYDKTNTVTDPSIDLIQKYQ
jgi:hypothetical protein